MSATLQTKLLHLGHWPSADFEGIQPGVFSASSVIFPNTASFRSRDWTRNDRFIYGPHGTPTTFELEARIAALEGGAHSLLCASGLAAISLVYVALLKPNDELLVPVNVYAANRSFITQDLMAWGVRVRLYDPTNLDSLEFSAATKLVWIEAPCSITFEFPDVITIAERARKANVLSVIDNTWGAGVALRPFDLGVDISVQSLSKYASGGGDVMMGSITCHDEGIHAVLKLCAMRWGVAVCAMAAASVLKGLSTLQLRYQAQDTATRYLLADLIDKKGINEVLHPSLESSVGHEFWQRDCTAAAGLFSIVFQPSYSARDVDHFIDALQLFKIGFGWGGPISLVLPQGRSVASVRPIEGELVRFSVGLESPDDLLSDIKQALCSLPALSRAD